jgi:hypothetical protein
MGVLNGCKRDVIAQGQGHNFTHLGSIAMILAHVGDGGSGVAIGAVDCVGADG